MLQACFSCCTWLNIETANYVTSVLLGPPAERQLSSEEGWACGDENAQRSMDPMGKP